MLRGACEVGNSKILSFLIFLLSSSTVEKVGGGLNIGVKSEKKRSFTGAAAAAEPSEYKVRIEHTSGAGKDGGKRRKNELMNIPTWSSAWTFTCSCGPKHYSEQYRDYTAKFPFNALPIQSPICKHIGAALIVHFH